MEAEPTVWLSGAIVTMLNKIAIPLAWLAALVGVPVWAGVRTVHIPVALGLRFVGAWLLILTVWMLWMAVKVKWVGYCGHELICEGYFRDLRVPFNDVAVVERVWWGRARVVRIRLRHWTAFGDAIYYLPKWGGLRAFICTPEEELRRVLGICE